MGKLVMSENVTLDGVIQDPAGDEGFRVGGRVGLIGNSPQLPDGRVVPPHHWTRVRPFIAALKTREVPARQYITRYAISDWRGPST
jgi:hypothetical protein